MCGILGAVSKTRQLNAQLFTSGLKLLERRGPDASGIKILKKGSVILGHTRLSIIDTSTSGDQPLANAEQSLWITYNGEIYNYLELKKELELKGRQFKTKTDTEVILQAYDEWGAELISKLRGIYAFAIYCSATNVLFLARDSSGAKPLYYIDNGDTFGFSSTPTALLAALGKRRLIDDRALVSYLWFGNIPGSLCVYRGVKKLSPGTTLLVTQGSVYKDSSSCFSGFSNGTHPDQPIEHRLESLIRDSLSINQRSDVPVAYLLSGGLDSSIICALAQERCTNPIPTFSIGFDSLASDETPFARQASSIIGTNHSTAILSYEKALGQLWDVASSFDEPFHINGLIPFAFLCKYVRECGYKVAIGGDGADEIFGGYLWHSRWWQEHSPQSRLGAFRSIRNRLVTRSPSLSKYLEIFLESSGGVRKAILSCMVTSSPEEFVKTQLHSDTLHSNDFMKYPLQIDQGCFLPDHCLPKVDRCSMYYGLEVRVPFLDQSILSFMKQLSGQEINPNFQRKYLLKSIFKKQLKGMDLNRKKGFSSPIREWWEKGLDRVAEYAISKSALVQSSELLISLVKISKESQDIMSLVTLFSLALWSDCWMEDQKLSDYDYLRSL